MLLLNYFWHQNWGQNVGFGIVVKGLWYNKSKNSEVAGLLVELSNLNTIWTSFVSLLKSKAHVLIFRKCAIWNVLKNKIEGLKSKTLPIGLLLGGGPGLCFRWGMSLLHVSMVVPCVDLHLPRGRALQVRISTVPALESYPESEPLTVHSWARQHSSLVIAPLGPRFVSVPGLELWFWRLA